MNSRSEKYEMIVIVKNESKIKIYATVIDSDRQHPLYPTTGHGQPMDFNQVGYTYKYGSFKWSITSQIYLISQFFYLQFSYNTIPRLTNFTIIPRCSLVMCKTCVSYLYRLRLSASSIHSPYLKVFTQQSKSNSCRIWD